MITGLQYNQPDEKFKLRGAKTVRKILIAIILSAPLLVSASDEELGRWETADQETVRLLPSDFPNLPKTVSNDLDARGCTVPQIYYRNYHPHNVISGSFKQSGVTDWAVLCSIDRQSTLLVYWGGSAETVSEVSTSADKHWLQDIGGDNVGFSRGIATVNAEYIADQAFKYGREVPPVLDHEGIDEVFMEKASKVYYWYKGKWLTLQGSD